MAVSRTLERLLRIRHLEEEQNHQALASAITELRALEHALLETTIRHRQGRSAVSESINCDDPVGRQAGLIEIRNARRLSTVLKRCVAASTARADEVRARWIGKRVERKQVETLLLAAKVQDRVEEAHHAQQTFDQWYLVRRYQREGECAREERPSADSPSNQLNDSSAPAIDSIDIEA
jgi:flagellar biosynthesis chaperone FliJ